MVTPYPGEKREDFYDLPTPGDFVRLKGLVSTTYLRRGESMVVRWTDFWAEYVRRNYVDIVSLIEEPAATEFFPTLDTVWRLIEQGATTQPGEKVLGFRATGDELIIRVGVDEQYSREYPVTWPELDRIIEETTRLRNETEELAGDAQGALAAGVQDLKTILVDYNGIASAAALESLKYAERSETAASDALTIKTSIPAAIEGAVDEAMPTKADTIYVDQQDRALSERIDEEKWMRGTAPGEGLDHLLGLDHEGLWKVGASIPGKPGNAGGWVQVVYDPYSGSTEQVFWASSPTVPGEWKRKYWSGAWRSWHSVVWEQGNVATGADLNTITQTGAHTVMSTVANDAPGAGIGPLIVFPFGNGVVQIRIDGRASRMWSRRVGTAVDPWVEYATMNQVNAAITDALAGAGGESWYRGSATDHAAHADDLRFLGVFYTQGLDGMPFTSLGAIEVLPIAYGGFIQRATDWSTLEVWTRKTAGGVFQDWQLEEQAGDGSGTGSVEWIKHVPLAVTTGGGAAQGPGSGRYRTRVQFGAPVLRWRLHVSTRYPIFTTIRGGAMITDVSIGTNTGGGQIGEPTPILIGAQSITAGEEWVSDWIAYDLTDDSLIDMTVDVPGEHYNLLAPAWKQDEDGTWAQVNRGPLWMWIEAETFDTTPTVALIGDSTGAGHGSIEPVWDAAVAIAGREQGFLPVLFASSGDTLSGNIALDDPNFARWSDYGPYDSVVIQAGSNDLNTGATLTEMQDRFTKVAAVAQQLAPVVVGATIKPRYPTDTVGEVRVPYNEWLLSRPDGVWVTLDYSAAVAPDGAVAAEDNDDGAHLKKSGHEKMATAYRPVRIARPRLAADPDEDSAPQVTIDTTAGERVMLGDLRITGETGTRDVSHLLVNATGILTISRTGNTVFMDAQGVTPTAGLSSGGTFISNLPPGFRPTMRRDFALPMSLTATGYRSAFQFSSGAIGVWSPTTTDKYYLHLSWNTTDAWPSTLPGTPT